MKRRYIDVEGPNGSWQLHAREAGSGPAIVMLHPSPLSSAFMEPLMGKLSDRFHCVALDTPGFGQSDPLPEAWDEQDLTPYVRAVEVFLDALAVERPIIYGSATGAQIAVEFAKAHPSRCGGVLLENIALFSEEERSSITVDYFPDITPQRDGSHLQTLWRICSRSTRYFPWYDEQPGADRRGADAPPAVAESMLRDYLMAGPEYERAYRAAFANEGPEALSGVTVPTRIVQWADTILGEYAQRLENAELPAGVELRHAASGMPARMDAASAAADELLALSTAG